MVTSNGMALRPPLLVVLLGLLSSTVDAFYLPGSAPIDYKRGEQVPLWLDSIKTGSADSRGNLKWVSAYDAYTPPFGFCPPPPETPANPSPPSLGATLFGDRSVPSSFNVSMRTESHCESLCTTHLNSDQVGNLRNIALKDALLHDWRLDGLPVSESPTILSLQDGEYVWHSEAPGFRFGNVNWSFYSNPDEGSFSMFPHNWTLSNHFDIKVHYHRPKNAKEDIYRVVAAFVDPKSIDSLDGAKEGVPNCEATKPYMLRNGTAAEQGQDVAYTYSVTWQESTTPWATRWDHYLLVNDARIHVLSLVNSIVIALFLCVVVSALFARLVSSDLKRYNSLSQIPLTSSTANDDIYDPLQNDYGWKLLHGEVARPPKQVGRMWIAIFLGNGAQLGMMGFVTLVFACLGVLSPANRGSLTNVLLVTYTLFGFVAGYVSSRVYITWQGQAIRKNIFYTSIIFPTALLALLFSTNFWLIGAQSSGAIPFTTFLQLAGLWFGISVPLALLGGWLGARKGGFVYDMKVNSIPRQIPALPFYLRQIPSALLCGLLPFGAGFMELYFLLQSLFGSKFYYAFGYLFFSSLVVTITTALTSVLSTYVHLCSENYHWQTQSILSGASSSFYLFLYSLVYWSTKLQIDGLANKVLYLSYVGAICTLVGIVGGTVSFFSSAVFIRTIYSRIRID